MTVVNKKQQSMFSGQGEAPLHAPNVRKKTWVQRPETSVCHLGSSGPVWLIQQGLCAGIKIFLMFVAPSYVRLSESEFGLLALRNRPPVLRDSLWNPESDTLGSQFKSAEVVWTEDSMEFHRISFKISQNILWFDYGRLIMVGPGFSGFQRNDMGEGFWVFFRPGTGSCSCKKSGWFMYWMAVMWWKLVSQRVRGRRKVLCF